jgi:hypothetical protein
MAAELLDIQINIGATTEDLGAEIQKAENLLKKLQSALKRSTDVGEIQKLNTKISSVEGAIGTLSSRMNGVAKPTNDATQSLINFSRIAQDAPYGIMGIANNLNPMLESFQQLAKTEGGTKKALDAMLNGLSGPAGIGVALGLVSSLAVVFQKQITQAFEGPAGKLKDLREELKKLNDEIYKMAGSAQASQTLGTQLVGRITNEKLDITQRENALRKFQELYSQNKEIKDLEIKDLKTFNAQYLQSLNNKAAVQQLEVSKEQNYIDALSAANSKYKKLEEERDNRKKNTLATTKQLESGQTTEKLRSAIDAEFVKPLKDAQLEIANAKAALSRTLDITTLFDNSDPKKETKKGASSPIVNYAREENKQLNLELAKLEALRKKFDKLDLTPILDVYNPNAVKQEDKRKSYFENKAKDLTEESNKTGLGALLMKDAKARNKQDEADKKRLKDLNERYTEFAQNISQNVTGAIFGMVDAMQQGLSLGDALGQMFGRLARSIAESLVQAAAFAGVMSLLSGGASNVAGGGVSFFTAFKSLLGLADGGIATGPTLAMIGEGSESEAVLPLSKLGNIMQSSFNAGSMNGTSGGQNGQFVLRGQDLVLAMQRSNSALNLRRGV